MPVAVSAGGGAGATESRGEHPRSRGAVCRPDAVWDTTILSPAATLHRLIQTTRHALPKCREGQFLILV